MGAGNRSHFQNMKIEIIRQTVAGGKRVNVGDELTVSDTEGKLLIRCNKAKLASGKTLKRDKMTSDTGPAVKRVRRKKANG